MKLKHNEFLGLVYADLFDYPLTLAELKSWAISGVPSPRYSVGKVRFKEGYYFLAGREKIWRQRKIRERASLGKIEEAQKITDRLKIIPTVDAVFLTGSLAVSNASRKGDIDLMVITQPGSLWLTRFLLVVYLKISRRYRSKGNFGGKACPNIFLDSDHLAIKERNLYTAHEVLQARCLFDRGGVERRWLTKNRWVEKILPKAYKYQVSRIAREESVTRSTLYWPVELVAFGLQYLYMRPKMTNEKVGRFQAFFHPQNLAKEVELKYQRRLAELVLT